MQHLFNLTVSSPISVKIPWTCTGDRDLNKGHCFPDHPFLITNAALVHSCPSLTSHNCSSTEVHSFLCCKARSSSPFAISTLRSALALFSLFYLQHQVSNFLICFACSFVTSHFFFLQSKKIPKLNKLLGQR